MMQSVQVIIERLKTNPEDFFGDADSRGRIPKFQGIAEKLDDLLAHKQEGFIHRLWFLNDDEKEALIDAYKEARRARFEANVFHTLLTNEENLNDALTYKSKDRYSLDGKRLMQGGGITTQNMLAEATEILNKEFDKAYAKNRNPRP